MDAILKIGKYVYDQVEDISFGTEIDWAKKILQELEGPIREGQDNLDEFAISITLRLVKRKNDSLKDHFVIKGKIKLQYLSECVRCLVPFLENQIIEFSYCLLDECLASSPEYQDISEIFCDGECMELGFYTNREIDLADVISEQAFLYQNQRPLHDDNCEGLCSICGFNLNLEKCVHHRSLQNSKINLPNT